MGFAVDPEEVCAAALPVADLANSVAAVDLATDLAPLALALPGSCVGAAVSVVGAHWARWVCGLRDAASLQSGRLSATAIAYAESDVSVLNSLSSARESTTTGGGS